jgi:hypothetical protein
MQLDPSDLRNAHMCSTKCRDALKESNFTVPVIMVAIHEDQNSGNVGYENNILNIKSTTKDW